MRMPIMTFWQYLNWISPARRIPCAARVRESGNRRAPGVDVKKGYGTKARDKLTVHMPGAG